MKILVTGSDGYIGKEVCLELVEKGHTLISMDIKWSPAEDIRDLRNLYRVFDERQPDQVIHLAALVRMQESIEKPSDYYDTNVVGTLNVLQAMQRFGVKDIIFASTGSIPYSSAPYAMTKLGCEQMIYDFHKAYGINAICLRYMNVVGRQHKSDTHLFPNIARALENDEIFHAYGNQVRDYIHVDDVARYTVDQLDELSGFTVQEIGTGMPSKTSEVIDAACRVWGKELNTYFHERREGDAYSVVAAEAIPGLKYTTLDAMFKEIKKNGSR